MNATKLPAHLLPVHRFAIERADGKRNTFVSAHAACASMKAGDKLLQV